LASRGDFHCHSTASDGAYAPAYVVELAYRQGVRVLALTDHDSTEAWRKRRRRKFRTRRWYPASNSARHPGRRSTRAGYYLFPEEPELQATLQRLRDGRRGRGELMVEKLQALGLNVPWEQVQRHAGDASVGRPHVAAALVESGCVANVKEAFDKYIRRNGPAYAEREKMTPAEAVATIVRLGGVACLAHPADLGASTSCSPS
jgi:predicted metal-dependent phosphoesterase TrpH